MVFAGTEWLCPIAADERKYELCSAGAENFLPVMPLDVVVATPSGLQKMYDELPPSLKETPNGKILNKLLMNKAQEIQWAQVFDKTQATDWDNKIRYFIWERNKQ